MSKASTELLERIHAEVARQMLQMLEDGTAGAKEWAVIVKFLKDNSIDAIPTEGADTNDAFNDLVKRAHESIAQYQ